MRADTRCAVYIMTNARHTVLYTGVTSDLATRVHEHKLGTFPSSFTKRYNLDTLVYYEPTASVVAAIAREKQIKAGSRAGKIALIEAMNPAWNDLSTGM
jgi:putative endonuclease